MSNMQRKVVFYTPYALWETHLESALELIETYLHKHWNVVILSCKGELKVCDVNKDAEWLTCARCRSRFQSGLKWIGPRKVQVYDFYLLNKEQRNFIDIFTELSFTSIEELCKFKIDGSDIGHAVYSSLVDLLGREPYPDVVKHQKFVRSLLRSAIITHYSLTNWLIDLKPDEFVIFNGRVVALRPAMRVAQSMNIKTWVQEVGGVRGRYWMTLNNYPHDIEGFKQKMEQTLEGYDLQDPQNRAIAREWFEERMGNDKESWVSFTGSQKAGVLPQSLSKKNINITIFVSSLDEMVAIPGWENPYYKDQNEGISKILADMENNKTVRFYLRIHPNLANLDNSQTRFLYTLNTKYNNVEIIYPTDAVSSYSLIDSSDLVISFGSTVGIEAAFNNTPSILMGRAFYEHLDSVIKPSSHNDLIYILNEYADSRKLPQKGNPQEGALRYGFYHKIAGYPYQYYRLTGRIGNGMMVRNGMAVRIKETLLLRFLRYISSNISYYKAAFYLKTTKLVRKFNLKF